MSYFNSDSTYVNALKRLDFYIASRELMDTGIFKPAHILVGYLIEFLLKDSIMLFDQTLKIFDKEEKSELKNRHNLLVLFEIIKKHSIYNLEGAYEILTFIQTHQARYYSELKKTPPKQMHFGSSFMYTIDHFVLTLDKIITEKYGVKNSLLYVAKERWLTHGMKFVNNQYLYRENYHLLNFIRNRDIWIKYNQSEIETISKYIENDLPSSDIDEFIEETKFYAFKANM